MYLLNTCTKDCQAISWIDSRRGQLSTIDVSNCKKKQKNLKKNEKNVFAPIQFENVCYNNHRLLG